MSCKGVTSSFRVSGASLASALAILSVKLSLRRLPTIVTTLYGAAIGGDPLLERNRLPCTSRTCKKMQVHEIGFGRRNGKFLLSGRCPADEDGLLCQFLQRGSNHLAKLETSPAAAGAAT